MEVIKSSVLTSDYLVVNSDYLPPSGLYSAFNNQKSRATNPPRVWTFEDLFHKNVRSVWGVQCQCGCSPPGTGTACSASGTLTQHSTTGGTNTAAQTTLIILLHFGDNGGGGKAYLFFSLRRSWGLKVFRCFPVTDETPKNTSPDLTHVILDT